jgi:uncharacterized protein (TIGR00297 family)
MIWRALLGILAAGAIAFVAKRARSLSTSGAVAATLVGAAAIATGWDWGVLLLAYFASSTLLSRVGRDEKEARTVSIVAKRGARDAMQVAANGLVFAASAAAMLAAPHARWLALGAGSLAASAADTWATEIGTLYGGTPRSVLTWRRVPPGTSGAVSLIGCVAACAGALFVAGVAWALGWRGAAVGVAVGGAAGALIDSVVGAVAQGRRWCDACERETERMTHDCGTPTRALRGVNWLDNDMVNLISNSAGGAIALFLAR